MDTSRCRSGRLIWLVVAAALAIRIALVLGYRAHSSPEPPIPAPQSEATYLRRCDFELGDSREYLLAARNLRSTGFFSWDGRTALTFRTPGYPLLLAALGGNLTVVVLVQSLLGALAVLLLFEIGRRLAGERVGILAAALLAVDLPSIAHTGVVMSETWFVAVLLSGTLLFCRGTCAPGARPGSATWIAGSGLGLGLAALTRPIALFGFLPFAAILVARRQWKYLVLFLVGFALLPGAWLGRNYVHYRRVGFSSISGYNQLYYNAALLVGAQRGLTLEQVRPVLRDSLAPELQDDDPLLLSERMTRAGTALILSDAGRYAWLCLKGLGHALFGVKSDEIVLRLTDSQTRLVSAGRALGSRGPASVWVALLAVVELLLAAATAVLAVVALLRRRDAAAALPLLVATYYLVMAMPVPDGRFRIPAAPFIYLAAASVFAPKARPSA